MHVQMIDVNNVRGFGKGFLDVAIFKDAAPDHVGTHRLVQDRLVAGCHLAVDHSLQRLIFNSHQFGRIFYSDGGVLAMTAATGSPW